MAVDSLAPAWDGSTEGVSECRAAEAERELHAAQERFAGAFAGARIGMALVATDGSFLQVNPALCAMLARDEASLLALDFQAITHPDDLVADLDQLSMETVLSSTAPRSPRASTTGSTSRSLRTSRRRR